MQIFFATDDNHERAVLFAIEYHKRKNYKESSCIKKKIINIIFLKHVFTITFQLYVENR